MKTKPYFLHSSALAVGLAAIAALGGGGATAAEVSAGFTGSIVSADHATDPLAAETGIYAAGQQQRRRRGGRQPSTKLQRSDRQRQAPVNIAAMLTKLSDRALALKSQGNCKDAIQMLACVAPVGQGYEVGQRALAECLVATGADERDDEARALQYRQAVFWASRSAELGDADAQAFLAYHNLAGLITPKDVMTGATWYYIFLSNPRYTELGFGRLPVGTEALVRNQADDEMQLAARLAADAWRPVFDAPPAPPEMRIESDACQFRQRSGEEGEGDVELEGGDKTSGNHRRRS